MKLSEEKQKGILLEISATVFEICNLIFLFYIKEYLLAIIVYVLFDLYSNLLHVFSPEFIKEATSNLKERGIQLSRNVILYLIRSVTYVSCFIIFLDLAKYTGNYIIYINLMIILIISKLYREQLLKILHFETGENNCKKS